MRRHAGKWLTDMPEACTYCRKKVRDKVTDEYFCGNENTDTYGMLVTEIDRCLEEATSNDEGRDNQDTDCP